MSEKKSTTFEDVQKVASQMLSQGIKPTVRDVRRLTGGRNETVAEHLNDFNKKRDAEVSKLADEIGSSEIGKLIASEIQSVLDRRTASLNEIISRQESQIEELIGILKENEKECSEQVSLAESESIKAIDDANAKVEKYQNKVNNAEQDKNIAEQQLSEIKIETKNTIASIEQKSQLLIEAAQAESKLLISASNKQMEKLDTEASLLRDQVKLLSIDQAKHSLEKEQLKLVQQQLEVLRDEVADAKTKAIVLESQNASLEKDATRLNTELGETKQQARELHIAQTEAVEAQKQISQLQNDLSQSNREKDSLSRSLAISESNQTRS